MGGLIQLVAYGAQDIYLTSNPQITFFKVVYRRHTNFAVESIEQTFNGNVNNLGTNSNRVTTTISRNGDLIKDMWLELEFSSTTGAVYGLGNAFVKKVELEIGGQLIDRQYGEWMNIWSELTVPEGKRVGYDTMVGNTPDTSTETTPSTKLDVPLMFWFNRNPGLALPLIALQYHEVKLNLEMATQDELGLGSDLLTSCKLWVDYIFLDTDERRRFAQVSHEYLLEQVQFHGDITQTSGGTRADINWNHPVKEFVFVSQDDTANGRGKNLEPCKFNEMDFDSAKLHLNGQERFSARRPEYFLNVQTYKHHTHMPRSNRTLCLKEYSDPDTDTVHERETAAIVEDNDQYIYVYSFALNPEELQPSGTCNFSRIDSATLVLNGGTNSGSLKIYAVNYNVLRIMSGMAGLAYSN